MRTAEEKRLYAIEYRKKNKEKILEYKEKTKERRSEYSKEWYNANKHNMVFDREKLSKYQKEYREKKHESVIAYKRKYREQNKVYISMYSTFSKKFGKPKTMTELLSVSIAISIENNRKKTIMQRIKYAESRKILWK